MGLIFPVIAIRIFSLGLIDFGTPLFRPTHLLRMLINASGETGLPSLDIRIFCFKLHYEDDQELNLLL